MGTKIAVIYGNVDRRIHSIVIPDDDSAIVPALAKSGETLTTLILSTYKTYTSQTALAQSLGLVG